jgi:hypothetical protein
LPPAAAAADVNDVSPTDSALPTSGEDQSPVKPGRKTAVCWRYADAQWTRIPGDVDLNTCVRAVFAGRCPPSGGALFGRWGERGLRSLAGKIDLTSEEGDYRPLTSQSAECAVAPFR